MMMMMMKLEVNNQQDNQQENKHIWRSNKKRSTAIKKQRNKESRTKNKNQSIPCTHLDHHGIQEHQCKSKSTRGREIHSTQYNPYRPLELSAPEVGVSSSNSFIIDSHFIFFSVNTFSSWSWINEFSSQSHDNAFTRSWIHNNFISLVLIPQLVAFPLLFVIKELNWDTLSACRVATCLSVCHFVTCLSAISPLVCLSCHHLSICHFVTCLSVMSPLVCLSFHHLPVCYFVTCLSVVSPLVYLSFRHLSVISSLVCLSFRHMSALPPTLRSFNNQWSGTAQSWKKIVDKKWTKPF